MPETFKTLLPPFFTEVGQSVSVEEASEKHLWIATANLWIVQTKPVPAVVYQLRNMQRKWAPGKLDVLVGGKVNSGEEIEQALIREAKEEMQLPLDEKQVHYVGKKLHIGILGNGYLNTVPHIFIAEDNRLLSDYNLQKEEVDGIFSLPLDKLIQLHSGTINSFEASGLNTEGASITIAVSRDCFPENWDDYHYKMASLALKFINGETLMY